MCYYEQCRSAFIQSPKMYKLSVSICHKQCLFSESSASEKDDCRYRNAFYISSYSSICLFHFEDCNRNRTFRSNSNRQNRRKKVLIILLMSRKFLKTEVEIVCTLNFLCQGVPVDDKPLTDLELPYISAAMLNDNFVCKVCCFVQVRLVFTSRPLKIV